MSERLTAEEEKREHEVELKEDDELKEVEDEAAEDSDDDGVAGVASALLAQLQGMSLAELQSLLKPVPGQPSVLSEVTLKGVADVIKEGKCRKVVVMAGAGISVAAGIPDFRTPGTGLYDNLQKYNLPHPTAVFELGYFRTNPVPFYMLAKELYPGNFQPTPAHYLIRLLHDKGVLMRAYTQNVDGLERIAGVPDEKLIEAHGSFHTAHCIDCKTEHEHAFVKEMVFSDQIPKCRSCAGLVKPDIVFFGESLPTRFFRSVADDFMECDLLIVMGTSLQVQPFASLIGKVLPTCPRLLINRESVGEAAMNPLMVLLGSGGGFNFNSPDNKRDVRWLGDVQQGAHELVKLIGWEEDFQKLLSERSSL